jgi:PTH1 family peptidyl-tRNA hydrolase
MYTMAHVIIGLGNPGGEYAKTRHNAGRMVVEAFAKSNGISDFALRKIAYASVAQGQVGGNKTVLVLPEVAMNLSGKSALAYVKSVRAARKLLVVRDDLDLPLGTLKMTVHGRGSGGHKGVESIMRALRTKEFVQLKIGISSATAKGKVKKPSGEQKVVTHVLGKFSPKDDVVLKKVFKRAGEGIEIFITEGVEAALLFTNTK